MRITPQTANAVMWTQAFGGFALASVGYVAGLTNAWWSVLLAGIGLVTIFSALPLRWLLCDRFLSTIIVLLTLAAPLRAEWYEYSPAGSVNDKGILQDVVSRCDEQGKRTAYEPDKVTYCHEATHMVNSRIRNSIKGRKVNAFYVGGGKAVVMDEPRITLGTIARYVREHRNSTFQLYFIDQQQHWNNEPLYILDEWSAYCNGSQAANELGIDNHGSHDRCLWFCHYADCLVRAVKEHDPQYAKLAELTEFVEWQKARAAQLTGQSEQPKKGTHLLAKASTEDYLLIDMPTEYRERNYDGSCGYISVANCLRFCGLWQEAEEFRQRYGGGCSRDSLASALDRSGIKYRIGQDGDEQLLREAVQTGRGAAVCWGGAHCINLVGIEGDNAVLLGNGVKCADYYHREPWEEFMANHRSSGGWSVMILSGAPGEAVTE